MLSRDSKSLILIIFIFIAACIETDLFLPALSDIMQHFAITEEAVQSILTWNFIGICISGPFYGPVSDAIGRRRPLFFALGLFLLGSLMTLYTSSFSSLLWGRFLQGLGSGGCFTLGTAIVFDLFKGERAIGALTKINSICPFIMASAPLAGGYLNHLYGFQSNFLAIALCVLASCLVSMFFFEETHPLEERSKFDIHKIAADFAQTARSLPFWQTTLIVSLPNAGYLAFLSATAVLFVIDFGVSQVTLPFYQATLLGVWVVASLTLGRAVKQWGTTAVKLTGTSLTLLGGIGFGLVAWLNPTDPIAFTSIMALYTFGVNWSQGLYFPEGMQILPDIKGITSSFLTSARLLITAATIALVARFYDGTIYPVAYVLMTITLLVTLITLSYERRQQLSLA